MSPQTDIRIVTVSASSQVKAEDRGQVVVSGSYGGEYNAYHAGKWGLRGVILISSCRRCPPCTLPEWVRSAKNE